jgi:hypothetical protein
MPAKRPGIRLRFLVQFVLVIGGLVGLHAGWSGWEERALSRRIEAMRSSGDRVIKEDFAPSATNFDPTPNAARDLIAAAAILDDDGVQSASVSWVPSTMPANEKAWPFLSDAKDWFEPALKRIALARSKPRCDFEHNWNSPLFNKRLMPELNANRSLSLLLVTAAFVEHHRGQDAMVMQRLGELLYLGGATDRSPGLCSHLVAQGITVLAAMRVEQLAPDLHIASDGSAGAAAPAEVRKIIAALLDEAPAESAWRTAVLDVRMVQLDLFLALDRGEGDSQSQFPGSVLYAVRPVLYRNLRLGLERNTALVAATTGARDWPTAKAHLEALPPMQERIFTFDEATSIKRAAETQFRVSADRRLAATALAIRLYQFDHAGARPATLDELTPTYLPAVPRDPMAANDKPIGYLPRPAHPVLYSVNLDGIDQGGDESAMPGKQGEIDEFGRLDRVFYLSTRPHQDLYIPIPETPGAAQPAGYVDVVPDPNSPTGYSESVAPWDRQDRKPR